MPKFMLDAGHGERDLIKPRIRFHDNLPPGAKVKVMTEGILLREFRRDPYLRRYSCLIFENTGTISANARVQTTLVPPPVDRRFHRPGVPQPR